MLVKANPRLKWMGMKARCNAMCIWYQLTTMMSSIIVPTLASRGPSDGLLLVEQHKDYPCLLFFFFCLASLFWQVGGMILTRCVYDFSMKIAPWKSFHIIKYRALINQGCYLHAKISTKSQGGKKSKRQWSLYYSSWIVTHPMTRLSNFTGGRPSVAEQNDRGHVPISDRRSGMPVRVHR